MAGVEVLGEKLGKIEIALIDYRELPPSLANERSNLAFPPKYDASGMFFP